MNIDIFYSRLNTVTGYLKENGYIDSEISSMVEPIKGNKSYPGIYFKHADTVLSGNGSNYLFTYDEFTRELKSPTENRTPCDHLNNLREYVNSIHPHIDNLKNPFIKFK